MSFAHRPTSTCTETAPRSDAEQQLRVDLAAAYRLIALNGVRCDIALMRTPDGHSQLELSKFQKPTATTSEPNIPVNTLGIRRRLALAISTGPRRNGSHLHRRWSRLDIGRNDGGIEALDKALAKMKDTKADANAN